MESAGAAIGADPPFGFDLRTRPARSRIIPTMRRIEPTVVSAVFTLKVTLAPWPLKLGIATTATSPPSG